MTAIAELLAVVPRARQIGGAPAAGASSPGSKRPTRTADDGLTLDDLHPAIAKAAGPLFTDGHYAPAAFQAWKAVEVRLRELSRLDQSGRALAAQALSGDPPLVTVSRHSGRTGDDEQEGLRFIFMGAMQGLRNPGGHELGLLDRQEAMEELALASLLMRWLDTSRIADRPPTSDNPRPARSLRVSAPPKATRPRRRTTGPSPRVVVLAELLEMSHEQARTSVILDLKLRPVAEASGIPLEQLQDTLVDLLAEGLAEPYAATMGQSAEQGACRITGAGVRELARMRSDRS